MSSYEKRLSAYYDLLYSQKDYNKECELIKKYSQGKKLLDIGAGTLSHSIILCNHFDKILATDFSESMINQGLQKIEKLGIKNINTYVGPLDKLILTQKYSTVISMFNVVNHITKLSDLVKYFLEIDKLIEVGGTFIFDCWNGVNCIIDTPKEYSKKQFFEMGHTIFSETKTTTDKINSMCEMDTEIKVYDDSTLLETINFKLTHRLWTIDILKEILSEIGFEFIKIIPYFDETSEVTQNDSRVTFILKKIEKWNTYTLK
jgi:ubiquinone/menaquinone biosynthesis C-methylase UbiE